MNAPLRLSADQRAKLRKAIVSASRWREVRTEHGYKIETMTASDLLAAAAHLRIDIEAVTGAAATSAAETTTTPPAVARADRFATVDPVETTRALNRVDAIRDRMTDADKHNSLQLATELDAQNFWAKPAQLLALIEFAERYETTKEEPAPMTIPAPAPPSPVSADAGTQLAALIAQLAAGAMNPEQVRAIVDEQIAAALNRVPSIRIECKGPDGETRQIDGHQHPRFKDLLRAASARMANGFAPNIWLAGPAGSGKTHAGHQLAEALGLPFHLNGALSMPHELLGFIDAAGNYHRTPFREAYENGGVYMFDEVDGSDNSALLALNAALANGSATFPDAKVPRHPNCIILASANTWGLGATAEYVGRAKIDAAFLSRFPVRIAWDYDTALEIAISGNEKFARRVIAARERARAAGLKVLIDPRASQAGAALIAAGMTEDEAAGLTYLANVTADQRRILEA